MNFIVAIFHNAFKEEISQRPESWGAAINVFAQDTDQDKIGLPFALDWKAQDDLDPWMLNSLGYIFDRNDRLEEGAEVRLSALKKAPDNAFQDISARAGSYEVLFRNSPNGAALLYPVVGEHLSESARFQFILASALLQLQESEGKASITPHLKDLRKIWKEVSSSKVCKDYVQKAAPQLASYSLGPLNRLRLLQLKFDALQEWKQFVLLAAGFVGFGGLAWGLELVLRFLEGLQAP